MEKWGRNVSFTVENDVITALALGNTTTSTFRIIAVDVTCDGVPPLQKFQVGDTYTGTLVQRSSNVGQFISVPGHETIFCAEENLDKFPRSDREKGVLMTFTVAEHDTLKRATRTPILHAVRVTCVNPSPILKMVNPPTNGEKAGSGMSPTRSGKRKRVARKPHGDV